MTGRPRLAVGEPGKIRYREVPGGFQAIANHRDPDGQVRQYARSGATKTAAKAELRKALAAPGRTRKEINCATRMTDLAARYFADLAETVEAGEAAPGTLRLYRGYWDRHGAPGLGGLSVAEADIQVLDDFLATLRRASGPNVAKKVRTVLSGMMGIAVRVKAIPSNPIRDVRRIRGGTAKPAVALTPEQTVDMLTGLRTLSLAPGTFTNARIYRCTLIDPYLPDLVLWMLGTSLRVSQALAVHWPWIDLDAGVAAVGPNIIRVKGEGLRLNQGTSKSRTTEMGVPPIVLRMLERRREETLNQMGPVFPDRFGGLRDPNNTLGDLRAALDMAGYPWVTSHVFRKTVATVLDDAGLSARSVADQLSHARVSMTQDHYMARRAVNPEAVVAIEAMLGTEPARRVVSMTRSVS